MDVWEYFESRDREIAEQSAAWEGDAPYVEEEGSDGQRGRIWGRLILTDRSFLSVHELVAVTGSGVTRLEYGYYLIFDGAEIWGEERDPTHDPALHRHDRNHTTYPSRPISFKDALRRAWLSVSAEEETLVGTELEWPGAP